MATSHLGKEVMDNGLAIIRARIVAGDAVRCHLLSGWTAGMDYSTTLTKSLTQGAGKYYTLLATNVSAAPVQDGTGRKIVISAFTVTPDVTDDTGPFSLHIGILNTTSGEIYAINDVNNDQSITAGNPVDVATYDIGIAQAVQS